MALELPAMRARSRLLGLATIVALVLLVMPQAAMAADGVGLWGRTDDKVVTFWGFGLIIFFSVLVTVLALIQNHFDNRKERRRHELERLRRD
jgi:hypothetical protein